MEGYLDKNTPDVNWWTRQVKAGERYRDIKLRKKEWDTYYKFYRNHFKPGIFTKNMFFTMKRSIVPRTYYRNPTISAVSAKPGAENIAFSRVMERVFNSLLTSMQMKKQLKKLVDCSFTTGAGVGKLGFGTTLDPTPLPGGTESPIDKDGRRFEYRMGVEDNMPWFFWTPTEDFVLPQDCPDQDLAWYQAHWISAYRDDIEHDPRFKHVNWRGRVRPLSANDPVIWGYKGMPSRETIRLLEIRDRRNQTVSLFAPDDTEDILFFGEDELQTIHSSPWYIYTPNPDETTVWGVSDATILYQYQEQLNEIKTKKHWHMRRSLVKMIHEKGAITEEQANRMLSEDVSVAIEVADINGIKFIETDHIPQALFQEEQEVMNDIRDTMGFSRNAMGEYQSSTHGPTTVETRAVERSLNLRMNERQDNLADILLSVVQDMQTIIFRHWGKEQVIKVLDMQGYAHWVAFTGKMLQEGQYEIKLNIDSATPETKEVREQRAMMYYDRLKENPYVNNYNLTKLFLNEWTPNMVEELLLEQPPVSSQPLSLGQFAGKLSGSNPPLQLSQQ